MLALAQPAEGKIIYTPTQVTIGGNDVYGLDLNHDGITDFNLKNGYDRTGGSGWLSLSVPSRRSNGVWASQSGYIASVLPAGILVGSKAPFASNSMEQMAAELSRTTDFGPWCGAKNRYLGLKITVGKAKHFAWARLSVACRADGVFATLTGYAYETVANKAIRTGKTKGRDVITFEPAALGHLARGASAISTWRQAGGNK